MQKQPDLVQRVAQNAQRMRKLLQTIDGLQVLLVNVSGAGCMVLCTLI